MSSQGDWRTARLRSGRANGRRKADDGFRLMHNKPPQDDCWFYGYWFYGCWFFVIVWVFALLACGLPVRAEGVPKAEIPTPEGSRTAAVQVRAGNHPGFGRLVFDVSADTQYRLSRDGDQVHLSFSPSAQIGDAPFLPRNVASFSGGDGMAELVVLEGTRVRPSRIGERVVVDVFDLKKLSEPKSVAVLQLPVPPVPFGEPPPMAVAEPPAGIAPDSAAVAALHAEPLLPSPLAPAPVAPAPLQTPLPAEPSSPAETPLTARSPAAVLIPKVPAADFSGPIALAAARAMPAPVGRGTAFSVPFGAGVGAAALRRGNLAFIVFDERRPVDMAALRADPVLAAAIVQLLPAATLIRLPLPPGMEVAMQRTSPNAWTVAVVPSQMPIKPIHPTIGAEDVATAGRVRISLPGDAPGQVVSLADPDTGATLLLGTQRQPGQGIAVIRRTPRYLLLPTWQGVAVQPLVDSLSLRSVKSGFMLAGADLPMAQDVAGETEWQEEAARLTRRFDFPASPVQVLQLRMQTQVSDAAVAPARARGRKRLAAAQTMIALGLAVEAQAVLKVATEEDPTLADSPDAAGLGAVAALLAGRIDDSRPIDDPHLSGSDEIALWRAVRMARQQEHSPQAAGIFATTLPLVLAYPAAMRDRLLPLAVETMIAGGEAAATTEALARQKDNPVLALARAMKLQVDGNVDNALAAYGAVVQGPDRRQQALAASRAVELALASHRIGPAAAADALDRQLYTWRGDYHELALRERVAALRAESGAWRPALALLRETLAMFPDQKAEIRQAMNTIFAGLLRDRAVDALAPFDLISLLDENTDLLAEMDGFSPLEAGISASAVQAKLAEKLLALDLPRRAGPQLERLMRAVPQGAGRAGFGASLAALKLREDDAKGALETLSASNPATVADLPSSLAEQRALLFATASARIGDRPRALAALAVLNSSAAGELRSTILEQAGDWPAAAQSLADQAARLIPADGALDDTQRRLLVRLASAASQAGDEATLGRLRAREIPRMTSGPLADMFKLLTADRVQSTTDLKRSGREMASARTLSAGIKALEPPLLPVVAR